jgi:uncharacterized protein
MKTIKIWIDLDNSPHVPLFVPIIEELRARGYEVMVTARNAFQVRELADLHGLQYRLVGRHHGKHFVLKLWGLGVRALQLLPTAVRERPALSVSHGSRSQLAVSALLGIPSLMISDYEFSRTWAMIRPTWAMVPEVIPSELVHTDPDHVLHYPGIKEDVYVSRFRVDSTLREQLGVGQDDLLVTLRPPATEAHYHNPESEDLFRAAVDRLASDPRVRVVLLPRNGRQADFVRKTWPALVESAKVIFPPYVLDGLNLIWHSDLVISGGGTMNREAAALGVPVYTIFRGPLGAVDRFLASKGRLVVISNVDEVSSKILLVPRKRETASRMEARTALSAIVEHIIRILEGQNNVLEPARGK